MKFSNKKEESQKTMAKTQAAKKASRQNETRRIANREKMSQIRTERKKFLEALKIGKDTALNVFRSVQSLLGKAVKKNRLHWKTAARLVSRMSEKITKIK